MDYGKPVFHVYAVRTIEREDLMAYLTKEGIQHGIHYPFPVHLLPAHADLGYKAGDFPESEKAANQVLSLPMFPELTDEQIHTVADAILAWGKA
jgi:dTDP-4-amino-4,6-dideoxygalactose transaminase